VRWDLQDRLRELLIKLVREPHAPAGLDQIFLTSHSLSELGLVDSPGGRRRDAS